MPTVCSVLLIEDIPRIREIFKHALTAFGCKIVGEAESQRAGVSLYQNLRPDLTLLDIRLAMGDGIHALQEILELNPDAYVVMLSTMDEISVRNRCIEIGAKGFIAKGQKMEAVIDALEEHIVSK